MAELETSLITCTVGNDRRCAGKMLFAMVDVDLEISGISILIQGVQARRLHDGGTSIHLPTYKDSCGQSQAAVVLPC
jgi:hypothetical protein